MNTLLKRFFNIRQDEILVFTTFFLFYFLIGIQFSIGLTVSEALFLSEVGPGFLPYMYIFNAFVIIFVSGLYSSYTEKLSVPSMFKMVLLFFIGLIVAIRLLITADIRALAMPIAYPLLHTLFVMFTNMLPNNFRALYGLHLDVLQSKRLVPLILTGGRYGGIVGGLSIPLLIPVLGSVANLLFVWVGAIVVSIGFVQYIELRLRDHMLEGVSPVRKRGGKGGRRREGNLALLKTNRYVAAFAAFSFIVVILRSFQDFQYSVVFREVFPERAQLAAFLGYFTAIGSGVSLLIQTFITPRLIRRLGVGTANLIYPLTTMAGLAGMLVSPGFYSAVILRFNNKNLQESVRNSINALLYNAVSPSVRGRVGAFVAGQVVAVASILSGIILLIVKPTGLAIFPLSARWLAFISLLIAGAYLIAGFFMRHEYGAALRKMLEERNLGLFRYAQEGFGPIDQESMAILIRNLREGDDDLCLFAAGMLSDTGDPEAIRAILEEIHRRGSSPAVCELLRILARAPGAKENEAVRRIWSDSLRSEDPECRIAAMDAIARAGLIDDVVDQVQESLKHESPQVRAQAVRLLVRSDDLFCLASGLQALHAMLEQGRPDERICALRCIGELENPRFIRRLIPYLYQSETEVREAALEAIAHLITDPGMDDERLDEILRVSLSDLNPSIRRRGVQLLGRRGKRVDFERLLAALSDPEGKVRREAVSSLKTMKRKGALSLEGGGLLSLLGPWLFGALNGSVRQEMTAGEIVEGLNDYSLDHMREVYEIINHLNAIEQRPDAEKYVMLRKTLWDRVSERQALLLELLGVIGDEKTVDTVTESLAQGSSSSRAIAIETLSNVNAVGPTRQIILMLEPLLLAGTAGEKLSEGRKFFELSSVTLGQVLRTYMNSNEPWIRAVAIDAAGHFLAGEKEKPSAENREEWAVQLKSLAYDEDPYVREAAMFSLGQMGAGDDGFRAILRSNEKDAEERVRTQARRALLRLEAARNSGTRPRGAETKMLSTIEKVLFLKGIKMFETMTADQLKILSNISKDIQVPAGKILFEEGDPCDYLYVIVEGEIEIFKDIADGKEELLATLGPTASFGEIALFGDEGRSAGARAKKDTSLLGIEKEPLLLLIHEHPAISIAIIAQLAYIIRNQNEAAIAKQED